MAVPSMDAVGEIIANAGYEIVKEEENMLQLRDLASGISVSCIL